MPRGLRIMIAIVQRHVPCLLAAFVAGTADALAQSATPPPDKIDRLLELLSDPDVKAWLAAQDDKAAPPPPARSGRRRERHGAGRHLLARST